MRILICISFLMMSLQGFADTKKSTKFRKTQSVSFDAADIDGAVRSPDGAYVNPKKGVKFMPLYKVNQQFDEEIKDSVEHLK